MAATPKKKKAAPFKKGLTPAQKKAAAEKALKKADKLITKGKGIMIGPGKTIMQVEGERNAAAAKKALAQAEKKMAKKGPPIGAKRIPPKKVPFKKAAPQKLLAKKAPFKLANR